MSKRLEPVSDQDTDLILQNDTYGSDRSETETLSSPWSNSRPSWWGGAENIKPCDKAGDVSPDDADDLKT